MAYAKVAIVSALSLVLASAGHGQDAAQTDLPAGPGRDKLIASCTACHAITQVTTQLRTEPQWADVVEQMIGRGATVADDDYPVIVHYLGEHFGPAAKARTPASQP